MFTGIIEARGMILEVSESGTNRSFWVESELAGELRVDQSVCHNGICLTVEAIVEGRHRVTAIKETLDKTNAGDWQPGQWVNLERCLLMSSRLDGHLVQGHVDGTGTVLSVENQSGSWKYTVSFPAEQAPLVIEKGSICLNGISLTAHDVKKDQFSVSIIPYTYNNTNLPDVIPGSTVNLEFDLIGKYLMRRLSLAE